MLGEARSNKAKRVSAAGILNETNPRPLQPDEPVSWIAHPPASSHALSHCVAGAPRVWRQRMVLRIEPQLTVTKLRPRLMFIEEKIVANLGRAATSINMFEFEFPTRQTDRRRHGRSRVCDFRSYGWQCSATERPATRAGAQAHDPVVGLHPNPLGATDTRPRCRRRAPWR
jgi:hypothetical protein